MTLCKLSRSGLLLLLLMPAICLLLLSCGPSQDSSRSLDRLIDRLSAEDIIASPLNDLHLNFRSIEEDLTGKWKFLPALSSRTQETWAYSTSSPILGDPEAYSEEETVLTREGKVLPYLQGGVPAEEGWRWLKTNESLDMRSFDHYDRDFRGVRVNSEQPLQFTKLLPEGETLLEFRIVVPELERYQPTVVVMVDEEPVEEIIVSRRLWYRVRCRVQQGEREFRLQLKPAPGSGSRQFAVVGVVRIESASDLLLLARPYQPGRVPPGGSFSFHYYNADVVAVEEYQDRIESYRYLYYLRRQELLEDGGVRPVPSGIKKKINLGEYSYNALIAPPKSHYSLPVTIPAQAALNFKYGIIDDDRQHDSSREIRFQVILEAKKERKTLLDQTMSLISGAELAEKNIDLSPWQGRKGSLHLITEEVKGDEKVQDLNYPVWINPVITSAPASQDVNVVLISLDTLRPDYLGCYGYPRDTSPSMDDFAGDAVLFENTYSTSSWTLPGHVSMLTALDGLSHQVYFPLEKMGPEVETIANLLRQAGYFSAGFTAGGYLSSTYGFAKGFDSYQEIRLRGDRAIRYDESERLAEMARDWISRHQNKKFFLFLHTYQPHDPYTNLSPLGKMFLAKGAKWDRIKMDNVFEGKGRFGKVFTPEEQENIKDLYAGEIRYTDETLVKPVLDILKGLDLYERTLVIITSDHGEEFYEHEAWLHDHSLYQEGIKIPLLIKFPRSEDKGMRVADAVRITDIMPTILDYLDLSFPAESFDGSSLIPVVKKGESESRFVISDLALRRFQEAPTVVAAVEGSMKLIINHKIASPYVKKTSLEYNGTQVELYDLAGDPGETKNLVQDSRYRSVLNEMLRKVTTLYVEAEKRRREKAAADIDSSLEERLRALGYIK